MTAPATFLSHPPEEVLRSTVRAPAPVRTRSAGRHHGVRLETLAVGLVLLLSPLFLASDRPAAVMLWSAALGVAGAACSLGHTRLADRTATILIGIGIAFAAWAAFQAIPLPGWRGGVPVDLPAGQIGMSYLSFAPGASFLGSLRVLGYVIHFWLALRLAQSPHRARKMGQFAFLIIFAQAAYALIALGPLNDIAPFSRKMSYLGFATGTFVSRNALAAYLGMGLILGIALLPGGPVKRWTAGSWLLGLAIAVIATALLATQSRMGLVATLAGVLMVAWRRGSTARLLALTICAGLAGAAMLWPSGIVTRLAQSSADATARLELYRQVLAMIASRPAAGFGLDSFPLAYQLFHTGPVWPGVVWNNPHSSYLALWAEAGIPAGTLPIIAGSVALAALWKKAGKDLAGRPMALAGFGALVLGATHSLIDFSLEIPANAFLLITLVALGLGSPAPDRKDRT